ncbi:PDR/VanB family oxidoreductase [Paraglaciecola hydrolytica]|uniref:Vanillate O-demethylase oxidoreductase n=1 Tax=Paraglaciecola hydrolytica TaxID=1799789 RepID=A0A148KKE7_9ALTE|nr:PDR/VanB family oxidoreductase [Paraglaciecola hydrolytica]KXI26749.1 Vanillate O-demethylase oxidoreductase [Paraglaciecola hydrolytica]
MIEVIISEKSALTQSICRLKLRAKNGSALPKSTPGAHIDVHLPNGIIRQYSLCNEINSSEYEIAVLNEPQGRGGSSYVHESLKVGDTLSISEPKNLFPLDSSAKKTLLMAAGIGITPILSMAEHLLQQGADFSLHYCIKSPEQAAYIERINNSGLAPFTHFHFSQSGRVKLAELIQSAHNDLHLYVCGPAEFNDAVIACASEKNWQLQNIHREYFSAAPIDHSDDGSFEIEINSSGDILTVPADQSMLDVLEDNGYFIPMACAEGVCGTCITGLLSGQADHKDVFMTAEEHAKMDQITPCCSRAKSARLKLDL